MAFPNTTLSWFSNSFHLSLTIESTLISFHNWYLNNCRRICFFATVFLFANGSRLYQEKIFAPGKIFVLEKNICTWKKFFFFRSVPGLPGLWGLFEIFINVLERARGSGGVNVPDVFPIPGQAINYNRGENEKHKSLWRAEKEKHNNSSPRLKQKRSLSRWKRREVLCYFPEKDVSRVPGLLRLTLRCLNWTKKY